MYDVKFKPSLSDQNLENLQKTGITAMCRQKWKYKSFQDLKDMYGLENENL